MNKGEVDAGVIIHEGQLTFQEEGLSMLLDLGEWWFEKTQLPLPLGINIARKSLGEKALKASAKALYESIDYSLKNREKVANTPLYQQGTPKEGSKAAS